MISENGINYLMPNRMPSAPTESLSDSLSGKNQAELKKAAQEFEAVFIGQLFKIMRETIEESGMEGNGLGKGIYTDLFDQRISMKMAERGALGIGDMIYKSLAERAALEEESPVPTAGKDI